MKEIMISEKEAGQRIDKFLGKYLNQAPKSFLYKMMRKKNIVCNGKKVVGNEKLLPGDCIQIFLAQETLDKFSQSEEPAIPLTPAPLEVVYEDKHVLLLNKPAGVLSQKAVKTDVSLVEYLTAYLLDSGQLTREDLRTFHPGICNRLDRNTSGLVAAGKSLAGLQALNQAFRDRTLRKYYRCIVAGKVTEGCKICGYLKKDKTRNLVEIQHRQTEGAQEIQTEYRPICTNGGVTLLEVHLITGKAHQIRAHLASIGHPIAGDVKYGNRRLNQKFQHHYGLNHQLLHAYRLEFPEMTGALSPLSGKKFTAELPQVMKIICGDCFGIESEG